MTPVYLKFDGSQKKPYYFVSHDYMTKPAKETPTNLLRDITQHTYNQAMMVKKAMKGAGITVIDKTISNYGRG